MPKREPITYADSVPDLPQSDFAKRLQKVRIARVFAMKSAANDNRGHGVTRSPTHIAEKTMVEKDHSHPVLKPSLGLAADVDAAGFNARWEAERLRATQSHSRQPQTGENPMSDNQDETRRPEETLREGPLKAAIWRNEGESGTYHSVTVARTYKDREGNLQDTQSFRPKDMLGLSELARRAHHNAHELDREVFKERRIAQQEQGQSRKQGHSH
ncbi:hypothetical protein [Cognatiyoonia sp. IB215182]|uniref:hypothetical protein n=1 Tax=Cognatiyoonia sp. IB215182 TaxID=3097353 RepID=UPI002A142DD8|nr:hypothetical protein [Cognatiyoonia sp. IB215182]MDX8353968.1 hypothetical protein [Cognatiyoonia sp. IB215182]